MGFRPPTSFMPTLAAWTAKVMLTEVKVMSLLIDHELSHTFRIDN